MCHFGPDLNPWTTSGWVTINICRAIPCLQRINPSDYGKILTFPLMSPWGWKLVCGWDDYSAPSVCADYPSWASWDLSRGTRSHFLLYLDVSDHFTQQKLIFFDFCWGRVNVFTFISYASCKPEVKLLVVFHSSLRCKLKWFVFLFRFEHDCTRITPSKRDNLAFYCCCGCCCVSVTLTPSKSARTNASLVLLKRLCMRTSANDLCIFECLHRFHSMSQNHPTCQRNFLHLKLAPPNEILIRYYEHSRCLECCLRAWDLKALNALNLQTDWFQAGRNWMYPL